MRNPTKHTPMRIAVLSDTHDVLRPQVREIIRTCDLAVHAGDVTNEAVMDELRSLSNICVVKGNNDYNLRYLRPTQRFTAGGVSFFVTHERRNVSRNLEGVQVVILGHTHRYAEELIDGRLWLNPGGCGRKRFSQALTMAVVTVMDGKYEVKRIELSEE